MEIIEVHLLTTYSLTAKLKHRFFQLYNAINPVIVPSDDFYSSLSHHLSIFLFVNELLFQSCSHKLISLRERQKTPWQNSVTVETVKMECVRGENQNYTFTKTCSNKIFYKELANNNMFLKSQSP